MKKEQPYKIAIVDDNIFIAKSIEDRLSYDTRITVVCVSELSKPILSYLTHGHEVDLILMDIEMPGINGIELTKKIKLAYPGVKILMLTVFDDSKNIFDAIKAGASGYLLKDSDDTQLINGIIDTMNGGAAMNPSIAFKALQLLKNPIVNEISEDEVKLSDREVQVLENLSKGMTYALVAKKLFLSQGTVRKHVENIYRKLHVHNKVEAIDVARQKRLI